MSGLLIIVVLTIHLLAVNLASAGPLMSIWLGRSLRVGHSQREELAGKLAWESVAALVIGMLTGGGLLYFSPSAGLSAAISRLPNRALGFAGIELAFSLLCLLIYAGCWRALRGHRWWHASLALLSSSNLLYHFPPLMSVIGELAANPAWSRAEILDRPTLLHLMMRSQILALTTHFVLASIAVAAIAALWHLSNSSEASWKEFALPLSRRTAWIAIGSSALQVPVGLWLLISLPHSPRMAMMGNGAMASLAFVGALLLTFLLLQRLLTIALGAVQPSDLRHATWVLAALVLLMTATLYASREKSGPVITEPVSNEAANTKTAVEHNGTRLLHSTAAGSARSELHFNRCTHSTDEPSQPVNAVNW